MIVPSPSCCFLPLNFYTIRYVSFCPQPHSLRALHKGIFCSVLSTHIDTVPFDNTCSCALLNPRPLLFTAREPNTMRLSALCWDKMLLVLYVPYIPSTLNPRTLSFKTFSLFRTSLYLLEWKWIRVGGCRTWVNPLESKLPWAVLKTQSVPRSKHIPSRL